MTYRLLKTKRFKKDFKLLDKPIAERIDKALDDLIIGNPYKETGPLQGPFRCKRKFRKGKYRVILTICEECMNKGDCRIVNGCQGSKHSRNDIILLWIDLREDVY
ncbi:MAG: hypothetical protein ABSE39_10870 [Candidatus Bathyarchaeia archaeon]